jgi:hypothetical protein
MTQLDVGSTNGFIAAGVEKRWSRFNQREPEMHDVFIVISEGADGRHVVRTVVAADEDDARQTHRENYADELIVAVHQDDYFQPRRRRGSKKA